MEPGSITPPSAASTVKAVTVTAAPATANGTLRRLAPEKTTTVKAMLHPASVISRTRMGQRVAFHGTAPVSSIAAGKIVAHSRIGLAMANLRAVRLAMRSTRRMAPLTPRAVSARTAALDRAATASR